MTGPMSPSVRKRLDSVLQKLDAIFPKLQWGAINASREVENARNELSYALQCWDAEMEKHKSKLPIAAQIAVMAEGIRPYLKDEGFTLYERDGKTVTEIDGVCLIYLEGRGRILTVQFHALPPQEDFDKLIVDVVTDIRKREAELREQMMRRAVEYEIDKVRLKMQGVEI